MSFAARAAATAAQPAPKPDWRTSEGIMPLYEYLCRSCAHQFERIVKFSDAPLTTCPKCGKETIDQMISAPAVQFKGSGWYVTDYARKNSAGTSSESSGSDSGNDSSGKSDGGSDSASSSKQSGGESASASSGSEKSSGGDASSRDSGKSDSGKSNSGNSGSSGSSANSGSSGDASSSANSKSESK